MLLPENSFELLNEMVSNTQGAKGIKESTATLTAAVLSSITTMLKISYPSAHSKAFLMALNGMKKISDD
jgi:hypothetical protein